MATIVILAAGLGTRFGGTKQLASVSEAGETLVDFSLFDAIRAGFTRAVFIVNRDILEESRRSFEPRLSGRIKTSFVCQEQDQVPESYLPTERKKPWGTGHALLITEDLIDENFCVINADDFYGRRAFGSMHRFLESTDPAAADFALIGYRLADTLSENGSVSRGECFLDGNGYLKKILERKRIENVGGKIFDREGEESVLSADTTISTNFWGFTPKVFPLLETEFRAFLEDNHLEKDKEFLLPEFVNSLLEKNQALVKVLEPESEWMGMTYKEDRYEVCRRIETLKEKGYYPADLWN